MPRPEHPDFFMSALVTRLALEAQPWTLGGQPWPRGLRFTALEAPNVPMAGSVHIFPRSLSRVVAYGIDHALNI
jgi:hypothetical protein